MESDVLKRGEMTWGRPVMVGILKEASCLSEMSDLGLQGVLHWGCGKLTLRTSTVPCIFGNNTQSIIMVVSLLVKWTAPGPTLWSWGQWAHPDHILSIKLSSTQSRMTTSWSCWKSYLFDGDTWSVVDCVFAKVSSGLGKEHGQSCAKNLPVETNNLLRQALVQFIY